MSRIICAPAPMVATEAKLDGKHTHFAAHPLLHENVAHFNPGSDLYVPARASKASSITPSQPTLKYMRCLNQAFIHPWHPTRLTWWYMKLVTRQWNDCHTLERSSWCEGLHDWYVPTTGYSFAQRAPWRGHTDRWSLWAIWKPDLGGFSFFRALTVATDEATHNSAKHHFVKYARADTNQADGAPL